MTLNTFKTRLCLAFKAMRKAGLVARQNFSCCGSCAGYEIATDIKAMPAERRAKVRGCAFYTRQAAADFDRRGFTGLYIPYGPVDVDDAQVGLDTVAVGQIVATSLREAGIAVEWDGSGEKTIFARFSSLES